MRLRVCPSRVLVGTPGWTPKPPQKELASGWLEVLVNGEIDVRSSPWFSHGVAISVDFREGDKPSLVISTLEALAVLVSLKIFFGDHPPAGGRAQAQVVPRWKNNRENGSALNKLVTTRFPASAVMMELARLLETKSTQSSRPVGPKIHQLRGGCSR